MTSAYTYRLANFPFLVMNFLYRSNACRECQRKFHFLAFLLVEISWIASNHVPLYTKTIEDRPLSTYFNKTSSLADQKALFSPRRDAFACNYQILIYSWRSYGHVALQSSLLHSCYCITRQAVRLLIFIQLNWDWPFQQHKSEKHQPPCFFFCSQSLHCTQLDVIGRNIG